MTRDKKKKVVVKNTGAITKGTPMQDFIEQIQPKPLKEHMKNLGKSGTITRDDFFTDRIVDKLIEESIDDLFGIEDEEGEE